MPSVFLVLLNERLLGVLGSQLPIIQCHWPAVEEFEGQGRFRVP